MIDLHAHLLPGIDDGPSSLEEAVAMCRAAAEDGCAVVVATPHQRHALWWNGDAERLEELRAAVAAELGDAPRLLLGAEVRAGEGLLEALERWPRSEVTTLAGSRYLLLELSRVHPDPDPGGLVHELVVAGWRPVLAHPEEIQWLADDLPAIARLVALGATLQITGASLLGAYGRRIQEQARALLDHGLAHFVASDAHDLSGRPPGLAAAAREIARRWGPEVSELLTVTNPQAVLDDLPLPAHREVLFASGSRSPGAHPNPETLRFPA
ncbi:MAG TPA: CpsB/CapC family capsule biosynthesis tyrosine phosphatase [Thermoanaerobaculia bacterium]|nr:CpsB/CapC family capsule biosynthesis tyrosine phosphatase [Thermoanaerobaculia bacterium]